MPNYPYSFQLPPLSTQDIPNNGAVGEFLGISAGGVLDWLPVSAGGGGDLLAANNLSELTATAGTARTNLGLGTTSSPEFANLTLTSPSLSTSAPVTISQTWNGTGSTVFTALKVNAVSTASASGSLLLDLQAGGVSVASVSKAGNAFLAVNGSNTAPSLRIGAGANINGWYSFGGLQLNAVVNSTNAFAITTSGTIISNGYLAMGLAADTVLERDSASGNTLALRNGINPQTFRVYNTFPGNGNNEFGSLSWVDLANEFQISTGQAGTGTGRALCLRSGGGINIRIGGAPGTLVWQFGSTTGHLLAGSDNSVDIGASGANRPRNVYSNAGTFGSSGGVILNNYVNIAGGNFVNWLSRSTITSITDGHLTLSNQANTDFGRLQFGGTSASFPAIKRSTTSLQAVLANDSGFTNIQGKLTTDTAFTSGAITDTGYIVLYDSTGTAYKVACTPV